MSIGKNSETSAFDPEIMGRSPYYDDFEENDNFHLLPCLRQSQ